MSSPSASNSSSSDIYLELELSPPALGFYAQELKRAAFALVISGVALTDVFLKGLLLGLNGSVEARLFC
jgi:hypothetical protein